MFETLLLPAVDDPAQRVAVQGESSAAVEAFRDGCTRGALKLPKSRGSIVREETVPDFAEVLPWGRSTTKRTYIKFNYPPSTYLVFADVANPQPKGFKRICALVSAALTREDATMALVESSPGVHPKPTWIPNIYLPEWTIDLPKLGYRKRTRLRDDGSILFEVATYNKAGN